MCTTVSLFYKFLSLVAYFFFCLSNDFLLHLFPFIQIRFLPLFSSSTIFLSLITLSSLISFSTPNSLFSSSTLLLNKFFVHHSLPHQCIFLTNNNSISYQLFTSLNSFSSPISPVTEAGLIKTSLIVGGGGGWRCVPTHGGTLQLSGRCGDWGNTPLPVQYQRARRTWGAFRLGVEKVRSDGRRCSRDVGILL